MYTCTSLVEMCSLYQECIYHMQSPQYYKIKINISYSDCVKYCITVQGQYQIPYKSVLVNS